MRSGARKPGSSVRAVPTHEVHEQSPSCHVIKTSLVPATSSNPKFLSVGLKEISLSSLSLFRPLLFILFPSVTSPGQERRGPRHWPQNRALPRTRGWRRGGLATMAGLGSAAASGIMVGGDKGRPCLFGGSIARRPVEARGGCEEPRVEDRGGACKTA